MSTEVTRKYRQSYWHADPSRRQQQHTAVAARVTVTSNRATVTVFITVWPCPFDVWVNACRATTVEHMCTRFGVDSST